MKIHCPHCLEETEFENTLADSVVTCEACKSVFDPRKKETLPSPERGAGPSELLPGISAGDGFGGYTLERKLGRGGMGVVFAATQLSLGRKVAIKVLAHDLLKDPEFVQRFEREARVLASLNHPNIVQVIDKGIQRGNVFLVMELVDGVSLRDILSEKKFPPADALKIIPQLCDALDYAHSRGVVHRDIKPENILLGRDGTVKIADFGLARIVGEGPSGRITKSNAIMGSLDYMAPEQRVRTRDADHRADIYALGVVFYEMLTGELPLGRFEPPSKKVKLEVDIDEVVLRVLAKDPELRYQRASEVASEIRRRTGSGGAGPGALPARSGAETLANWIDGWARAPIAARALPLVFGLILATGFFTEAGRDPPIAVAGGLLLGTVAVLAVWLRLAPPVHWRPHWGTRFDPLRPEKPRRLPRPLGALVLAAILIMIFLPRPLDIFVVSALAPMALAILSESPRLFRKDRPPPGAVEAPQAGPPAEPARTPVPEPKKEEPDMARNAKSALPSELQHLAAPVAAPAPAAAFATPRPRLSILALLGFLAAAALFALGAVAVGVKTWALQGDAGILDEMIRDSGGRDAIAVLVLAEPAAIDGAIYSAAVFALISGVLVLALNGGTFFSVGRRAGVRGGGYAFFGMVLSGLFLLATSTVAKDIGTPVRMWREIARQPVATISAEHLPNRGRLEALGAVNALARGGEAGIAPLAEIAAKDPSPAIRYAATFALARETEAADPAVRERARAALEPVTKDEVEAIRALARWGLEDPATRAPLSGRTGFPMDGRRESGRGRRSSSF